MTSSTTAPVSGSAPSGARGARVATDPAVRRPRSVLVTGASRGIGAAVAAAMAAQGDRVAGLSRTGTAPDGVLGVVADVTDPDAVDAAVRRAAEEHGPVEVLVAAAGTSLDALAARTRPADWDRVIATDPLSATGRRLAALRDLRAEGAEVVAVAALGGNPAQLAAQGVGAGDGALIAHAGRHGVTPGVRQITAQEDAEYRRRNGRRLLEVVARSNVYYRAYRPQTLDSWAELERWRDLSISTDFPAQ